MPAAVFAARFGPVFFNIGAQARCKRRRCKEQGGELPHKNETRASCGALTLRRGGGRPSNQLSAVGRIKKKHKIGLARFPASSHGSEAAVAERTSAQTVSRMFARFARLACRRSSRAVRRSAPLLGEKSAIEPGSDLILGEIEAEGEKYRETYLLPWGCHTIMELVLAALPVETAATLATTGATAERAAILTWWIYVWEREVFVRI